MISTIQLNQIQIYAYHGCYAEEQIVGNNFIVDVSLNVDTTIAAESDNIKDALNYVEVYDIVKHEMAIKSHLLENVVARICKHIKTRFNGNGLVGGTVKVAKLAPPVGGQMESVSVMMNI